MYSLQVLADNANQHIEHIRFLYAEHILPYVKGRSPKNYIAAAIAAFFSYQVYRVVHVPKKLRHIPVVPFWPYMRSVLSGESIATRARRVILPVLAQSSNGLYLRFDQCGWSVGIANPAAVKTLFLRTGELSFFVFHFSKDVAFYNLSISSIEIQMTILRIRACSKMVAR
jgi:hypothetical protein